MDEETSFRDGVEARGLTGLICLGSGAKIDGGIEKLENQAIVALLLSISGKDQRLPKVMEGLRADHANAGFRSIPRIKSIIRPAKSHM